MVLSDTLNRKNATFSWLSLVACAMLVGAGVAACMHAYLATQPPPVSALHVVARAGLSHNTMMGRVGKMFTKCYTKEVAYLALQHPCANLARLIAVPEAAVPQTLVLHSNIA